MYDINIQNNSSSYLGLVQYDPIAGTHGVQASNTVPSGESHNVQNISGDWVLYATDAEGNIDDMGGIALTTITDLGHTKLPWHGPGPLPSWANNTWGGTVSLVEDNQTYYFRYEGQGAIDIAVNSDNLVTVTTTQGEGQILGDPNAPGAKIDVSITSEGYFDGNNASITVNGQNYLSHGASRGMNVAIIDETSGELLESQTFDTYASASASDSFTNYIRNVPIGRMVFVAVKDEASRYLSENAKLACEQIGSNRIRDLGYRDSWCIVGARGAATGSVPEVIKLSRDGAATAIVNDMNLQPAIANGVAVIAHSAGFSVGNSASLTVGGVPIALSNTRGLNVAVVSTEGDVSQVQAFDTYANTSQSEAFMSWVNSLDDGTCVVVAVKDEASNSLTSEAKQSLISLGSRYANDIGYRDSFVLVGFKGAISGTVAEQVCSVAPCEAHYHLMPENYGGTVASSGDSTGFSIALASAGYNVGNNAMISIDGAIIGSCSRGINIVEIDEATGIALEHHTFDTYASSVAADDFAKHVEGLIAGQLVAVVCKDECSNNMTDRARRAATSLGSRFVWDLNYRDSWALLGRKGAAPGSVPEQRSATAAIGLELWFTTDGPRTTRPFRDIVVNSAGFSCGNAASIIVDGIDVSLLADPGGSARGLYVVVFDEQTGGVDYAEIFDTYASGARADDFATLINGLPNGRVVAIGVKDDCTNSLTQNAKDALISLGGNDGTTLSYRQSWAFIGRKGATSSMIASSIVPDNAPLSEKQSTPAHASYRLSPKNFFTGQSGFNVSLSSAGYSVGNNVVINVNGAPTSIPDTRGLNIVIFEKDSSNIASVHVFDTHASATASDDFADLINGLAPFTMVAISVKDEASNSLNDRAKRSLRSLGSLLVDRLSYRASWTMIGHVGYAPGGALEVEFSSGPVSTSVWVPYGQADTRRALFLVGFLIAAAVVAVLSVVVNVYLYSRIDDDVLVTIIPPAKPITLPKLTKRALLVSSRTRTTTQIELPPRADKIIESHQRMLGNKANFDSSDMKLLSRRANNEPTKTLVLKELANLVKGLKAGDTAYFVFVGHGTIDDTSGISRHCVKVWKDVERRTGQVLIYEDEIADILRDINPNINLTCVFHACFSGGLVDTFPALTSRANRGIALTANDKNTPAYFDYGVLHGLTEAMRTAGDILPTYRAIFNAAKNSIDNVHKDHVYPQNPQMVNMTGNDGGTLQNLDELVYTERFTY